MASQYRIDPFYSLLILSHMPWLVTELCIVILDLRKVFNWLDHILPATAAFE